MRALGGPRWTARFQRLRLPWTIWRYVEVEREIRIEVHAWLPFALALGLLVWYGLSPSPVVVVAFASVAGSIAAGFLWARAMALNAGGTRELKSSVMQVGDELEEQISLYNATWIPVLWAELVDRSDLPGANLSAVRGVGGDSQYEWLSRTICTRRGVFFLGPWDLRIGEPFGFFEVVQTHSRRQEVLVYPPLAALPRSFLPHRGAMGDFRPLNQPLAAETVDGMAVREFQSGDPLRKVHWPTTARRGEMFVKIFEPEAASRIWILPDCESAVQLGQGDDSTLETAVLLAASLAARCLQDRLEVGVFTGGEPPRAALPQRGQAHLWSLLECLAPLQAGQTSLARGLEQIRPLMRSRDLLVVITSSPDLAWAPALRRLLQSRGGAAAGAILLDRASFGGQGHAEELMPELAAQGIAAQAVRCGEIRPLSGTYGEFNRWEFITYGTGRAVARRTPRRTGPWAGTGGAA